MKRYEPALSRDDDDSYADMQECKNGEYVMVDSVRELSNVLLIALYALRVEGAPEKANELAKDASRIMEGI